MANYTRFQLRGDTKANWLSVNPILAKNEPAIETDTKRFKIGDGVSTYSQLSYGRNTGEYASLYNVTSLYPLPSGYYSHESAVLAIPVGERIKGLIITYETASGVWYTERFIGTDIANWGVAANWEKLSDAGDLAQLRSDLSEIETIVEQVKNGGLYDGSIELPKLSPTLASYIGSGGAVTNQADDDDLENTIINGVPVIREKTTKTYNPETYSGMGHVILRKNIVNGVNVLTQDMIAHSNTIYEIRYDFDLNNQEIIIPNNCILEFNGGLLYNGIIVGNNTIINAVIVNIFGNNLLLDGDWSLNYAYPEWFKSSNENDDTISIQKVFNYFQSIYFSNKTYYVSGTIDTNMAYIVKGSSDKYGKSIIHYTSNSALFNLTSPNNLNYIIFENITLYGEAEIEGYVFTDGSICIKQDNTVSFELRNILIEGFNYGVKAGTQTYYNYIENTRFHNIKFCLYNFNANNFKIVNTRASTFDTFITVTSGDGPLVIENGCFEVFSGAIVKTLGELRAEVIFSKNYVETYGDRKLPLGYSDVKEYFGGSAVFTGIFGSLTILDNMLQINDSSYLVYSPLMNSFTSLRNAFYIDKDDTNLTRIYHIENVCNVNVRNFYSKLSTKPYGKTLSEFIINGYNTNNFILYDSIFDKTYNAYLGVPILVDDTSSLSSAPIRYWSDGKDIIFKGRLLKGTSNNLINLTNIVDIPATFTLHVIDSNSNIVTLELDKDTKILSIINNIENLGELIFDNFRLPITTY